MKSISKSYGVPGLRLGVMASGNTDIIAGLKKDVAIWNINSFAEFYMQIEGKYQNDYISALECFGAERSRFAKRLEKTDGLRVIPSQANYIMCEITCINHNFFLAIGQTFSSDEFVGVFLDELASVGISYEVMQKEPLCLCGLDAYGLADEE